MVKPLNVEDAVKDAEQPMSGESARSTEDGLREHEVKDIHAIMQSKLRGAFCDLL